MVGKVGSFKGHRHSEETKQRIRDHTSKALKGKKFTEEHKRNLSLARLGKYKGKDNPFYGKKHTEQANEANRIAHLGKKFSDGINKKKGRCGKQNGNYGNGVKIRGYRNPNWRGGKSFEPYSVDWTETLKRSIRERDKYICQVCSQYGNTVHHIDYDKKKL